jgi:hypothetical protein
VASEIGIDAQKIAFFRYCYNTFVGLFLIL